jgi:hypothetical protein
VKSPQNVDGSRAANPHWRYINLEEETACGRV